MFWFELCPLKPIVQNLTGWFYYIKWSINANRYFSSFIFNWNTLNLLLGFKKKAQSSLSSIPCTTRFDPDVLLLYRVDVQTPIFIYNFDVLKCFLRTKCVCWRYVPQLTSYKDWDFVLKRKDHCILLEERLAVKSRF